MRLYIAFRLKQVAFEALKEASSRQKTTKRNAMDEEDWFVSELMMFSHLMTNRPEWRFREQADPTVAEAVARSKNDFLISYRHKESEDYAKRLSCELQELGYKVFYAGAVPELRLLDDEDLQKRLRAALHSSSVLAIIGSNDATGGEWVRWESETFDEDHWGRHLSIITKDLGPNDFALKEMRAFVTSAAIVYEEDDNAWENRTPSATTILCVALAREFFRVEMNFWQNCGVIPVEQRTRKLYRAMYDDLACKSLMFAMHWPDRDVSLSKVKSRYLREARAGGPTLRQRVVDRLSYIAGFLLLPVRIVALLVRKILGKEID